MPKILKADLELKKSIVNAKETEEGVTKTETLVFSNSELDLRVKGGPSQFQKFVLGSIVTISFSQSQTTFDNIKGMEEETEERDEEL